MIKNLKRISILLCILLVVFLGLEIGYFGVNRLNVRKLTLESAMIPTAFTDTSLLVFSDVYGNEAQLKKVQNIVTSEKPDLIIFLGNLLNEDTEEVNIIMNTLKSMEAPLGKFAILGAHDYTLDMDVLRSLYETSDFRLIENELLEIHNYTDDFIHFAFLDAHIVGDKTYTDVIEGFDPSTYTLSFSHSPAVIEALKSNSGILFAGQTLLGKVNLPFIGSIYHDDHTQPYEQFDSYALYVTGGVGTDSPAIRFNANPDIIYITFKSSQ